MTPFDLEAWKKQWKANSDRSLENSMRDSGWSARTAESCDMKGRELMWHLVNHLAATASDPACLFDHPELKKLQQAALFACGKG